jgi:hypothetical protein
MLRLCREAPEEDMLFLWPYAFGSSGVSYQLAPRPHTHIYKQQASPRAGGASHPEGPSLSHPVVHQPLRSMCMHCFHAERVLNQPFGMPPSRLSMRSALTYNHVRCRVPQPRTRCNSVHPTRSVASHSHPLSSCQGWVFSLCPRRCWRSASPPTPSRCGGTCCCDTRARTRPSPWSSRATCRG